MNHFMARLIFCLFAEDMDIFNGAGLFTQTIEQMTERDASSTDFVMFEIFRAMNVKISDRASAKLPNWANQFRTLTVACFRAAWRCRSSPEWRAPTCCTRGI